MWCPCMARGILVIGIIYIFEIIKVMSEDE
jgi:hypothetical protein